jgi:hypothetical protein
MNHLVLKHIIDRNQLLSSGVYNGKVVDNKDPGFPNGGGPVGRIKVSIPELTEGIPVEDLPWYSGKHNFTSGMNSHGTVPPIGSEVVVEFPNDDIYNGVYSYVIISSPPKRVR